MGQLAKPPPNPDDAGPIVRCLMGLLVTAGCDTAWDRTRVCGDAVQGRGYVLYMQQTVDLIGQVGLNMQRT